MTESLFDLIVRDLGARGVLFSRPQKRAALVDAALRGWEFDGKRVEVTSADWRRVVAFVDRRYTSNPALAGGVLHEALRSAPGWVDAVACAELAREAATGTSGMPSHANAGPPPSGACAHGRRGTEWCDECAAAPPARRSGENEAGADPEDPAAGSAAESHTAAQGGSR